MEKPCINPIGFSVRSLPSQVCHHLLGINHNRSVCAIRTSGWRVQVALMCSRGGGAGNLLMCWAWQPDTRSLTAFCHTCPHDSQPLHCCYDNTQLGATTALLPGQHTEECSPRYPECNSHVTLQGSFTGYF